MKKLKTLVVANNLRDWKKLKQRIEILRQDLKEKTNRIWSDIEIDVIHSSYENVIIDNSDPKGIAWYWFEFILTRQYGKKYDCIAFVCNQSDWRNWGGSSKLRGRHYNDIDDVIEFFVVSDEDQKVRRKDGKRYPRLENVFEHELKHGAYRSIGGLSKKKDSVNDYKYLFGYDNTHYFYEKGKLDLAWKDIADLKQAQDAGIMSILAKIRVLISSIREKQWIK